MGTYFRSSFPHKDASERLRQLSEEVSRIAADLSRLSLGTQQTSEEIREQNGNVAALSPDTVKHMLRARRLRDRFFDAELFADRAWDILLEMLYAEICQQRVTVSSLCVAASIPSTTALRWIAAMTDLGLLRRKPDPLDRRRMYIELTAKASDAMRRYFAHLEEQLAGNR